MNTLLLSQTSGLPFYRQIVDQLASQIQAGQLNPGQRLPSVREGARSLLVSLITVRRAYAELEAAGLIVRRQGQGTFVAEQVAEASSKRARAEARELLTAALAQALQRGLGPDEIRALIEQNLEDSDV
jgi:GntR family transcriptional regulator